MVICKIWKTFSIIHGCHQPIVMMNGGLVNRPGRTFSNAFAANITVIQHPFIFIAAMNRQVFNLRKYSRKSHARTKARRNQQTIDAPATQTGLLRDRGIKRHSVQWMSGMGRKPSLAQPIGDLI